MGATSQIEWTDATWNPATGCTKVSPGCDHCYAETLAERFRGTPGHYFHAGFDLVPRPDRAGLPLRWRRPRRVFVNSMSDLFHDGLDDEFLAEVFAVMAATPRHTYQVLTKRHGRARTLLSDPDFATLVWAEVATLAREGFDVAAAPWRAWPLPNVWLGVSAESQRWADTRVPALLATPAALRWVSAEPLLEPVRLPLADLDWVVVGGESGHHARPADPDWVADLVDHARAAGVPVFVKQLGTVWAHAHGQPGKGNDPTRWPARLRVRQTPGRTPF